MDTDDEMLRQKREELKKRLETRESIWIREGCINSDSIVEIPVAKIPGTPYRLSVIDEEGIVLFRSEDWFLESLLIPHIKIIIGDEEVGLDEIRDRKDFRFNYVCNYICALIRVVSYFYEWDKTIELSHNDTIIVAENILAPISWGERIKLKIGLDIINSKDIGLYVVQRKSSIDIEEGFACHDKYGYVKAYGYPGTPYIIFQEIERFLKQYLESNPCISNAYADPTGWNGRRFWQL